MMDRATGFEHGTGSRTEVVAECALPRGWSIDRATGFEHGIGARTGCVGARAFPGGG